MWLGMSTFAILDIQNLPYFCDLFAKAVSISIIYRQWWFDELEMI
jgi:hypothetical protein